MGHLFNTSMLCLALVSCGSLPFFGGQARAQDTGGLSPEERGVLDEVMEAKPMSQSFTWRAGGMVSGLFSSDQPRPFAYLALGGRKKAGGVYVDVHLPVAVAATDGLLYLVQESVLEFEDSFSFLRALNGYSQFLAVELLHLRVGTSTEITLGETPEGGGSTLRLSAGVVGLADFVVVEASRVELFVSEEVEEDRDAFEALLTLDPLILGPGVFVALGGGRGQVTGDLAVEVARDMVDPTSYAPNPGWVFSVDGEAQVEVVENLGMFARARWSMLTQLTDPFVYIMVVSAGVAFRL